LALYRALTAAKVPATINLYENTDHGFGMGANHPCTKALLQWLALHA
jgi:acetyl esterase/lipase